MPATQGHTMTPADDRKAFEAWCRGIYRGIHEDMVWAAWQAATAAERERAARIAQETACDTHLPTGVKIYGTRAAAAIRKG